MRGPQFHRNSILSWIITVLKVESNTSTSNASPLAATPALLTKTSIWWYLSLIKGMKASILLVSEISSYSTLIFEFGCLAKIYSLAFLASSIFLHAMIMFQLVLLAKWLTIPNPIPLLEPVTIMFLTWFMLKEN